jgi:hypothetical protein
MQYVWDYLCHGKSASHYVEISYPEQVTIMISWGDDDGCFVLDKHAELELHSTG